MVTGQHCHLSGQFLLQPITRNILSIIIDCSDGLLHEITFYGLYLPQSACEIDTSISILKTSGTVFFPIMIIYEHQLESVNYITQTEYLKKESRKSAGKTAKNGGGQAALLTLARMYHNLVRLLGSFVFHFCCNLDSVVFH